MRSSFATLSQLAIPAGAGPNSPQFLSGPRVPAEIAAYYPPPQEVVYVEQMRLSAGVYQWRALVIVEPQTVFVATGVTSFNLGDAQFVAEMYRVNASAGGGGTASLNIAALPPSLGGITPLLTYDGRSMIAEEQSYTPQLSATVTPPALGTGSFVDGRFWRDEITGQVWGDVLIIFGTAALSAGSGTYRVTLPTEALGFNSGNVGQADIWGSFSIRDNSNTDNSRHGLLTRDSPNGGPSGEAVANFALYNGTNPFVTAAVPWTWAASDALAFHFDYQSPI